MKIKIIRDFFDKKNNLKLRKKDEIMEVDADRGKQLISMKFAEQISDSKKAAE
ncbi:MAG: hypothetical protein J6K26_09580 [Lachnospiraceae bacterium]|nr:hypothetical protein [Lachnospiraceae bacterium]